MIRLGNDTKESMMIGNIDNRVERYVFVILSFGISNTNSSCCNFSGFLFQCHALFDKFPALRRLLVESDFVTAKRFFY